MIIEHIAVYTTKLELLKEFYIKYFNGTPNEKYHNPKTGLETYFITFESGARLELMQKPEFNRLREEGLLGLVHIAFKVGSKTKVNELTERIMNDGYKLKSAPRTTGDGYYESCIYDPEMNEIEIIA